MPCIPVPPAYTSLEPNFSDFHNIESSREVAVVVASGRKRIPQLECARVNLIPQGNRLMDIFPGGSSQVLKIMLYLPKYGEISLVLSQISNINCF